jgi:hypothetical protein
MNTSKTSTKFWTVKAASAQLGMPSWKVWRAIKQNKIRGYRFLNGRLLVRLEEIIEAIENGTAG